MKKLFVVAMTAALALTAAGAPAFAQDETITVEGVTFLDRNGNQSFDHGRDHPRDRSRCLGGDHFYP